LKAEPVEIGGVTGPGSGVVSKDTPQVRGEACKPTRTSSTSASTGGCQRLRAKPPKGLFLESEALTNLALSSLTPSGDKDGDGKRREFELRSLRSEVR